MNRWHIGLQEPTKIKKRFLVSDVIDDIVFYHDFYKFYIIISIPHHWNNIQNEIC